MAALAADLDGPLQEVRHVIAETEHGSIVPVATAPRIAIVTIISLVTVMALLVSRFRPLMRTDVIPAGLWSVGALHRLSTLLRLAARFRTALVALLALTGSRLTRTRFL